MAAKLPPQRLAALTATLTSKLRAEYTSWRLTRSMRMRFSSKVQPVLSNPDPNPNPNLNPNPPTPQPQAQAHAHAQAQAQTQTQTQAQAQTQIPPKQDYTSPFEMVWAFSIYLEVDIVSAASLVSRR